MIETWKDIDGYIGLYQISDFGNVKSLARKMIGNYPNKISSVKEKILKLQNRLGYKSVGLSKYGKVKYFSVHRLVCYSFIPNTYNKPIINHKNGIKNDNRLENLEWSTYSENGTHYYKITGNRHPMLGKSKRKKKYCTCGRIFHPNKDTSSYCSRSCATKNQMRFNKTTLTQQP